MHDQLAGGVDQVFRQFVQLGMEIFDGICGDKEGVPLEGHGDGARMIRRP
jgi:hypothetical protein